MENKEKVGRVMETNHQFAERSPKWLAAGMATGVLLNRSKGEGGRGKRRRERRNKSRTLENSGQGQRDNGWRREKGRKEKEHRRMVRGGGNV